MTDMNLFADVRVTEEARKQKERDLIAKGRLALSMANGLLGLLQSPHGKDFVAALEDLRRYQNALLLASKTDREAAVLIGRNLQLGDVLALVTNTQKSCESLANGIKQAEDRLRKLENPSSQEFLER